GALCSRGGVAETFSAGRLPPPGPRNGWWGSAGASLPAGKTVRAVGLPGEEPAPHRFAVVQPPAQLLPSTGVGQRVNYLLIVCSARRDRGRWTEHRVCP